MSVHNGIYTIFFKNFGKGILYVLVLPFLLAGMALYGVIAFFVFLFLSVKALVLFFSGRSLYEDLPEDIEAKKRLAAINNPNPQPAVQGNGEAVVVNTTPIITSTESADPFYVPEYLKDEDEIEEVEQTPVIEETFEEEPATIEERKAYSEPVVEEQEDAIVIENTPQNSAILEVSDDDEDEGDSGVNIDFH